MKSRRTIPALLVASLALALGCAPERDAGRPVSREIKLSISADRPVTIRNLSGAIRVLEGDTDKLEILATVHAGSPELLEKFTIEQNPDDEGGLLVRMVYPLDEFDEFQYPRGGEGGRSAWGSLFDDGRRTLLEFEGHRVAVTESAGVLLYADLEIRVPAGAAPLAVSNEVGSILIRQMSGEVAAVLVEGELEAEDFTGTLKLDITSGDIRVARTDGTVECKTVSGNVELDRVAGESVDCSTTSGRIRGSGVATAEVAAKTVSGSIHIEAEETRNVKLDTTSGQIRYEAARVEVFHASTSHGRVQLFAPGEHLREADVATSNGSVVLGLGPKAEFEIRTSARRQSVDSRYEDTELLTEEGEFKGVVRGRATSKINVDIGHGRLILLPGNG